MTNNAERNPVIEGVNISTQELIEREAQTPVILREDKSVRVKVTDSCGMTCTFCHNEGTPVTNPAQAQRGRVSIYEHANGVNFFATEFTSSSQFLPAAVQLREALGLNEVHWTGGEPSLSRDIVSLTKQAKDEGFVVKMTSNGETGDMKMGELSQAGLHSINFSIFGTTPKELASVQAPRFRTEKFATRKLAALDEAIHAASEHGIRAKANIVVPDFSHRDRVHRILERYGDLVEVRLLPSLDEGASSLHAIYRMLSELGAEPISRTITIGSSNNKTDFILPNGNVIGFKQISRVTLPNTCENCGLNNDDDCTEGFYGVRMYQDEGDNIKIGVCIQRMDITTSLDDFLEGPIPEEINQLKILQREALGEEHSPFLT